MSIAPATPERARHVEIFAVALAGLLLEIAYTRVISAPDMRIPTDTIAIFFSGLKPTAERSM